MDFIHEASFNLSYPDSSIAQLVAESVLPDLSQPSPKKTKITLNVNEEIISLNISSTDLSSLRAASNALLSLISTIDSTIETVGF
tara:strand:- start:253 stop:507 length:255 start_codon:yes stop_codon:yes gene_type:complete